MNSLHLKRTFFSVAIRKTARQEVFKVKRIQTIMENNCNRLFLQFMDMDDKKCVPKLCAEYYQLISPILIDRFLENYVIQFQNISFLTKISLEKKLIFSQFFRRVLIYCNDTLMINQKAQKIQSCLRLEGQVQNIQFLDTFFNGLMEYFGVILELGSEQSVSSIQTMLDCLTLWLFNQNPVFNVNYFSYCFTYQYLADFIKFQNSALFSKLLFIGQVVVVHMIQNGYFSLQFLRLINKLLKSQKQKLMIDFLGTSSFRQMLKTGIYCEQYVYNKKQYLKHQFSKQKQQQLNLSIQKLTTNKKSAQSQIKDIKCQTFEIFGLLPEIKYVYFELPLVDQIIHELIQFIYKKNQHQDVGLTTLYNTLMEVCSFQQKDKQRGNYHKVKDMLFSIFQHQIDYSKILHEMQQESQWFISTKLDLVNQILDNIPASQTLLKKVIIQTRLLQKLVLLMEKEDKLEESNIEVDLPDMMEHIIQYIYQHILLFMKDNKGQLIYQMKEQLMIIQTRQLQLSQDTKNKHGFLLKKMQIL